MIRRVRRTALAAGTALVLALVLAACEGGGSGDDAEGSGSWSAPASAPARSSGPAEAMGQPFGPACSAVPKSGAGSFDGMAQDPVVTALSHNPAFSTFVAALRKAGLASRLDRARDITVFAPTDDAFRKVGKARLHTVSTDKAKLTRLLTYHVVGRRLAPGRLAGGSWDSLAKAQLTVSGAALSYKVNGTADVICGNIRTANATVYVVDSVLTPPS